jgi:hypothetical protein
MRGAHEGEVALDAEVLVVARHAPYGNRKPPGLFRVEIVIAARFFLADAKRVAHQISGDQHKSGRLASTMTRLLKTSGGLFADVCVRRMQEAKRCLAGVRAQPKICRRRGTGSWNSPPEPPNRRVAVWRADEHDAVSGARKEVRAVRGGLDDVELVGNCDAAEPSLACVALRISVGVLEDHASHVVDTCASGSTIARTSRIAVAARVPGTRLTSPIVQEGNPRGDAGGIQFTSQHWRSS